MKVSFFNAPYLAGITDIDRVDMIDLNECKLLLNMANKKLERLQCFNELGHMAFQVLDQFFYSCMLYLD